MSQRTDEVIHLISKRIEIIASLGTYDNLTQFEEAAIDRPFPRTLRGQIFGEKIRTVNYYTCLDGLPRRQESMRMGPNCNQSLTQN